MALINVNHVLGMIEVHVLFEELVVVNPYNNNDKSLSYLVLIMARQNYITVYIDNTMGTVTIVTYWATARATRAEAAFCNCWSSCVALLCNHDTNNCSTPVIHSRGSLLSENGG